MSSTLATGSSYGQFIVVLLIFVGVLALTFFVTRWVSGYQKTRGAGSNIQLIESASISSNKYIQIVRVGKKYVALAICKDGVTMLTELNEEDLSLPDEGGNTTTRSFKDILSHAKTINENDENE